MIFSIGATSKIFPTNIGSGTLKISLSFSTFMAFQYQHRQLSPQKNFSAGCLTCMEKEGTKRRGNITNFWILKKELRKSWKLSIISKPEMAESSNGKNHSMLRDYADRVFHDRQLCEYLAGLVIRIGFDGDDDDEGIPKRWVKRERWPAWVVNMLRSRDRGDCAKCGKQLIKECKGTPHIDHIFPLVKGGCNDLVNLQLLCDRCNGRKKARLDPVKNSVPEYIRRHLER